MIEHDWTIRCTTWWDEMQPNAVDRCSAPPSPCRISTTALTRTARTILVRHSFNVQCVSTCFFSFLSACFHRFTCSKWLVPLVGHVANPPKSHEMEQSQHQLQPWPDEVNLKNQVFTQFWPSHLVHYDRMTGWIKNLDGNCIKNTRVTLLNSNQFTVRRPWCLRASTGTSLLGSFKVEECCFARTVSPSKFQMCTFIWHVRWHRSASVGQSAKQIPMFPRTSPYFHMPSWRSVEIQREQSPWNLQPPRLLRRSSFAEDEADGRQPAETNFLRKAHIFQPCTRCWTTMQPYDHSSWSFRKKHVNAKSLGKIFQVCIMASEADLIVDSRTLHWLRSWCRTKEWCTKLKGENNMMRRDPNGGNKVAQNSRWVAFAVLFQRKIATNDNKTQ